MSTPSADLIVTFSPLFKASLINIFLIMALNPPLNDLGEPFRIDGEHFIMQRKGIEFEIKVDGLGKFKGNGMVTYIPYIDCYS
jgi:hypothetical protein